MWHHCGCVHHLRQHHCRCERWASLVVCASHILVYMALKCLIVSAPLVVVRASSTFLTVGDSLQLNCTGLLLPYTNVPGQVTMTWTGPNGVSLSTVTFQSTAGGAFVNNVPQSSAQLSSAGTYTCGISVTFNAAMFLDVSSDVASDQVTVVIIAGGHCTAHVPWDIWINTNFNYF